MVYKKREKMQPNRLDGARIGKLNSLIRALKMVEHHSTEITPNSQALLSEETNVYHTQQLEAERKRAMAIMYSRYNMYI